MASFDVAEVYIYTAVTYVNTGRVQSVRMGIYIYIYIYIYTSLLRPLMWLRCLYVLHRYIAVIDR